MTQPDVVVKPFTVDVEGERLEDLEHRLDRTRLAPSFPDDGDAPGMHADRLAGLIEYWSSEYDWQLQQDSINELPQYTTVVQGVPIHFVHVTGSGPSPMPLVLTHGWPWTFWDYRRIIGPLSDPAGHGGTADDAFDVVVPSLPGFVFSSPLPRSGIDFQVTADLWLELMSRIGYESFGAHASDWGMFVSAQLGHVRPDRIIGVHLTGVPRLDGWTPTDTYHPWLDYLVGLRTGLVDSALRDDLTEWERRRAGHLAVQMTDPQSLAHAMHDSPAGLAAWLTQRRLAWSDCDGDLERRFDRDHLITSVMLYWLTNTFSTATRYYYEAVRAPWRPVHDRRPVVECPTGFSFFGRDRPPGVPVDEAALSKMFAPTMIRRHSVGGHWAPMEEPDRLVADLRDFFRPLRSGACGQKG